MFSASRSGGREQTANVRRDDPMLTAPHLNIPTGGLESGQERLASAPLQINACTMEC